MLEGKKFGKVTEILWQEWGIISYVVRNELMTSGSWLKLALNMLVCRGGGVSSIGCRGMAVENKANMCRSFFGSVLVRR